MLTQPRLWVIRVAAGLTQQRTSYDILLLTKAGEGATVHLAQLHKPLVPPRDADSAQTLETFAPLLLLFPSREGQRGTVTCDYFN